MAELHKNQVAWAAPEPKHISLAKKQDFIGPALQQLGQQAGALADTQKAIEDNTIEMAMKQAQDESLQWLSEQEERKPSDYAKHVGTVVARAKNKLSTFSENAIARFERDNPQYFEALELSANKVVLDKQTAQIAVDVKTNMPLISSEAMGIALKYGPEEGYRYGKSKLEEMVKALPISKQAELFFEYEQQFGGGLLQNYLNERDPYALVNKVEKYVDDTDSNAWMTPQQREYYKQLAGEKAKSIIKEQQELKEKLKTSKVSEQYLYSTLMGLAQSSPEAYEQAVFELTEFGGFVVGKDEKGKEIIQPVIGETLTLESMHDVLAKVKTDAKGFEAMQDARKRSIQDLRLNTARFKEKAETKGIAFAAALEQLEQSVNNRDNKIFASDTEEYKIASEEILKYRTKALEAFTPELDEGIPVFYKTTGVTGQVRISPAQSSAYRIASSVAGDDIKKINALFGDGGKFSYAASMPANRLQGGKELTKGTTVLEVRTLGEPMRRWEEETFGVTKDTTKYYGSELEAVNVMTGLLANNPDLFEVLGFPASVNSYKIRNAGISLAVDKISTGVWSSDAVKDEEARSIDTLSNIFNTIFKSATGINNQPSDSALEAQTAFLKDLAGSIQGRPEEGLIERNWYASRNSAEELVGYGANPYATEVALDEAIKKSERAKKIKSIDKED